MSDTPTTDVAPSDPNSDFIDAIDSIFAAQSRFAPDQATDAPQEPGVLPTEGVPGEPTPLAEEAPQVDPAPAEASPDPTNPGDLVVGGRVIPAEQAAQLIQVYDWVDGMDPNLAAAIQQLTTGEFVLTPRENPYVNTPSSAVEAPVPPVPAPPADPFSQVDRSTLDPDVVRLFDAQQKRLEEMESRLGETANIAGQTREQYEAEQRERAADNAIRNFTATHGLDPATDALLISNIIRAAAPLAEQNAHAYADPGQLFTESLERVAWSQPTFRDGLVSAAARSLSDTQASTSAEIQAKAARAAAATAPSGSVPRSEPNPRTMSQEERNNAMTLELSDKFFRKER